MKTECEVGKWARIGSILMMVCIYIIISSHDMNRIHL